MFQAESDIVTTNLIPPSIAPECTTLATAENGSLVLPFPNVRRSNGEVAKAIFELYANMRLINPQSNRLRRFIPPQMHGRQIFIRPKLGTPVTIEEQLADLDPRSSLPGSIKENPFAVIPAFPSRIPLVARIRIPTESNHYDPLSIWMTRYKRIVPPLSIPEFDLDDIDGPAEPPEPEEILDVWLKLRQHSTNIALARLTGIRAGKDDIQTAYGDQSLQRDGSTEVDEKAKEFEFSKNGKNGQNSDYLEMVIDSTNWFDVDTEAWKRSTLEFSEGQPHLVAVSLLRATAEEYQGAYFFEKGDQLVDANNNPIVGNLRGARRLSEKGFTNFQPVGMFRLALTTENKQSKPRMTVKYV